MQQQNHDLFVKHVTDFIEETFQAEKIAHEFVYGQTKCTITVPETYMKEIESRNLVFDGFQIVSYSVASLTIELTPDSPLFSLIDQYTMEEVRRVLDHTNILEYYLRNGRLSSTMHITVQLYVTQYIKDKKI